MNNIVDEVVLYSLPPSWSFLPMAGIACISEYLNISKIPTKVNYLNLSFEKKINIFKAGQSEQEILSFFIFILERLEIENNIRLPIIQKFVESSFPKLLLIEREYSSAILDDLIEEVMNIIDENIKNYEDVVLHGFSSKCNQWIPATIVAKRIKHLNPDANLVIGGWTNKQAAIDFLQSNNCFDYAIWGEGEIAILKLVKFLKGRFDIEKLDNIPGLIYNDNGVIKESIVSSQYVSVDKMNGFD